MRLKSLLLAASVAVTLSGCSMFDWMVYKIDIPQGNYVEQKLVNKLRVKMNKEQVAYVLGSPMLTDEFDPSRWYYLYHFKPGRGDLETRELILVFDQEQRLKAIEGELQPNEDFDIPLEG